MTDEKKPARARKSPAGTATAAKKPAARKRSATASLAEARFSPAPKSAPRKSAGKKSAAKKTGARKVAKKADLRSGKAAKPQPAPRKLLRPDVAAARRKSSDADSDAHALLHKTILDALDRLKAKDVVALDVRDKTSMTDLIVIATGTSSRHVKGLAEEVVKSSKQIGQLPLGVEGAREGEWVLVDLGDAIIHVMLPRSREFYGLERLWTVGDPEPADALEGEAEL